MIIFHTAIEWQTPTLTSPRNISSGEMRIYYRGSFKDKMLASYMREHGICHNITIYDDDRNNHVTLTQSRPNDAKLHRWLYENDRILVEIYAV